MLSSAFLHQAEVVQLDRENYGPLELVFLGNVIAPDGRRDAANTAVVVEWNMGFRGGLVSDGEDLKAVQALVPALRRPRPNPNVFLVPRVSGYTKLHAMLASVVSERVLRRHGIPRLYGDFWLWPHLSEFAKELDPPGAVWVSRREYLARKVREAAAYARAASRAFSEFIWTKLARDRRALGESIAPRTSLPQLSGDSG
jgi:hypothetical protein